MDNYSKILKSEERAVLALRSLYRKYGYMPYKMSKFEEYDLYVKNKDFLVSDSVITFNDMDGRLLALKPDVTLSIVKNTDDKPLCKTKLFYNENVYRVSGSTHAYKEIMQTGLECIGDIDLYDEAEVIALALESLESVAQEFVLDVSHMGIVSAFVESISDNVDFQKEVMRCLGEKNTHEIFDLCEKYGVSDEQAEKINSFIRLYGDPETVLSKLSDFCVNEKIQKAVSDLTLLWELVKNTPLCKKINFDFSIVNDMNYYNGVVFTGFVKGAFESVLSGGRYDRLMKKMGKKSGAIGFAVYLDALEKRTDSGRVPDADVLVLYDEKTDKKALFEKVNEIVKNGKSVSVQKTKGNVFCPETLDLREEKKND